MNKTFKHLLIGLLLSLGLFTFNIENVKAATGTFSISAPSSVTVGNNFNVTFTASASKIFYWQFYVSYSTSKLKLISGSTTIQGEANDATYGQSSVSRTLTFKALTTGTATLSISRGDADMNIDANFNLISYATKSKNVAIVDAVAKSTVNTLATLTMDGATLDPVFNKDVLSYTTELAAGTTEVNLTATTSDAKASIAGIGKVAVTEGANTLNVVVTAENGSTKTYVILVNVKEFNPVTVKVDGKSYTVVRQKALYTAPLSFTETTVIIGKETVLAYNNKKVGNLIGLKDSNGTIGLFIYDAKEQSYTPYNEVTIGDLTIYIFTPDKSVNIPNGYKETKFKIGKLTVSGWELDKSKDNNFYLVYGTNIKTGIKGFYQYDNKDETLQKFYNERSENLQKVFKTYMIVFVSMLIVILALIGMSIFQLMKFKKIQTKIESARNKKMDEVKKIAKQ